jgi:YVTN family beta-propeller protein
MRKPLFSLLVSVVVLSSVFISYSHSSPITITSPNGGEVIPAGSTYDISWEASVDASHFKLKYSMDNGVTWLPILGAENMTEKHYLWTVPTPVANRRSCRIRVKGYNAANINVGTDTSDAPFTIEVAKIVQPNGGETLSSGSSYPIQWEINGTKSPVTKVNLYYTTDGGVSYVLITSIPTVDPRTRPWAMSYPWTVPTPLSNKKNTCYLRVKAYNGSTVVGSDTSDKPFTIEVVRLASPNGGEILTPDDSITIRWTTNSTKRTVGRVRLYYSKNRGIDWNSIATVKGNNPGIYDWKVPMVSTTKSNCKMKVVLTDSYGNSLGADTSDGLFTIVSNPVKPIVSLISLPPNPFGLLTSQVITWQSNVACNYAVELGGNGIPGSGTTLSSGPVAPGVPMDETIYGTQLSFATSIPLWIYIMDPLGRTGSASVDLTMKPMVSIPIPKLEFGGTTILPGGQKAYLPVTGANSIAVLDINPESPTYNSVLKNIAVGSRPNKAASTPDGSRVYVTNGGGTVGVDSISVIETSTDTVIDTIEFGEAANGIAVTPDGTRAYFATFDERVYILDTDPGSSTYHLVIGQILRTALLSGNIAISPDGSKAVVNWQGMMAHAVDVIDVDPGSPTYNFIIGTPVPIVSGVDGDVAISPDNAFAYATNAYNQLCKIDLQTFDILVNGPLAAQRAFALTLDGTLLLMGNSSSTLLSIIAASDLSLVATVEIGTRLRGSGGIQITPDGSRAYMVGNIVSPPSEVIVVPLQ